MKLLSQLEILATLVITMNACSNDFLDEGKTENVLPFGESAIYISPELETADYWFSCPIAQDAEFSIEETPDWLLIENKTGNLTYTSAHWSEPTIRSIGTIRAKATVNPEFAKAGIYINNMTVKANNKSYRVPVYYITEGTPKVVVNKTLHFSYTSFSSFQLPIGNDGDGILLWDIVSMPDWLKLDTMNFKARGAILARYGLYNIPLKFELGPDLSVYDYEGDIMLRTNDKENEFVTVHVTADLGTPALQFSTLNKGRIEFKISTYNYFVQMSNQGSGMLIWQVVDMPDWLSTNKSSGSLATFQAEYVDFYCDAEKLEPGLNVATIKLKTNDPDNREKDILVTARGDGNSASTYPIEGDVVDAFFVKSLNTLVYATSQPDKLVFYDTGTKTISHEISLSKAPICFSFSEDYSIAAVGHSGLISGIDLGNYTISRTYEISNNVYDIAWVDSSLFCYTEQMSYSSYTYWFDIKAGSRSALVTNKVDGKTRIKKVPALPFLMGTSHQNTPSGLLTISLESRNLKSYAHIDLGDFWFSESGEYLFAKFGYVYRTNSAIESTSTTLAAVNPIDYLANSNGNLYSPWWLDHSSVTNKLFIINNPYYDQYEIFQFDDNDYLLESSYIYDRYYQPNTTTVAFEVQAHYVFANREGKELSVLKKGKDNTYWSLEFIQL